MLEQSVPEGLHPWKGPMLEQSFPEGPHPVERTTLEQFMKNCSLWEGLMLE